MEFATSHIVSVNLKGFSAHESWIPSLELCVLQIWGWTEEFTFLKFPDAAASPAGQVMPPEE